EVVLSQPHDFEFKAVSLAALAVDRVHVVQGMPVPLDQVGRRVRPLVHVHECTSPAAQRNVLEIRDRRAWLHTDLRSLAKASGCARFLLLLALATHGDPSVVVLCRRCGTMVLPDKPTDILPKTGTHGQADR